MGTKLSYTSSMTRKDGKAKGVIKTGVTLTRFTDSLGRYTLLDISTARGSCMAEEVRKVKHEMW